MYNELRKILAVFIAGTMLLGSVPVQAQTARVSEQLASLAFSGKMLPNKTDLTALKLVYDVLPKELRKKLFLKNEAGTILTRRNCLITLPDAKDFIYVQDGAFLSNRQGFNGDRYVVDVKNRKLIRPSYIEGKEVFRMENKNGITEFLAIVDGRSTPLDEYSYHVLENQRLVNQRGLSYIPSTKTLRGIGIKTDGSPVTVEYEEELLERLHNPSVRQKLRFRDKGAFMDVNQGNLVSVFATDDPLGVRMITKNGEESFVSEFVLKSDGVIDLFDGPVRRNAGHSIAGRGTLVPVKEYYKANLSTIRKLLAAVETKIHQRYPKYQGLFFKEFLKGDTKYMVAKLEQAAAKKATAKKAGQKAGKTALRSIGGAFFGIGLYAVLTATTANSVQAAEVTVTPKSEIIKKTVAEFKDAQVKSGVEKLAMFADPNKMPLIVRDAKLLKEMGQYKTMLEQSGLTEEEAAELIVNEMFAPLAAKEQAKQEVVKKVKHI